MANITPTWGSGIANVSRKMLMMRNMTREKPRLPIIYQEVEWIMSDGQSYINTSYIPQSPIVYNGIIYILSAAQSDRMIFGATNDSTHQIYLEPYQVVRYSGVYYIRWYAANGRSKYSNVYTYFAPAILAAVSMDSIEITANEGTAQPTSQVGLPSIPIFLLAWNKNNSPQYFGTLEGVGRITFSEEGEIKHNYIPCYRKFDGEIGVYDTVDDQFHANAGAGTLIKGPDV